MNLGRRPLRPFGGVRDALSGPRRREHGSQPDLRRQRRHRRRRRGSDRQRCLIDVKTTVDPKFTRTRVLYQLLGYALLDYDDRYRIDGVGVYLARQSLLMRWPLVPLLRELFGRADIDVGALRATFRDAVLRARVDIARA